MNENERAPKGADADGSTIGAQNRDRQDLASWQANCPLEARLISGQVTKEELDNWKKKFREYSGVGQAAAGVISAIEGGIQSKMANRYKSKAVRADSALQDEFSRLIRFVVNTKPELIDAAELDPKYREGFNQFVQQLVGMKTFFDLATNPPTEATWVIDEPTKHYLERHYEKVEKSTREKIASSKFWKDYDRNPSVKDKWKDYFRLKNFKGLPEGIAEATSTLISNAYHLTRALPMLTEDTETQEALSRAYDVISNSAKYIQSEVERFSSIGLDFDPLADISPENLEEAMEVWNQLIA